MSFHEKSAWACLVCISVVFVPCFALVFANPGYPVVIPAFLAAVVVLVTLLTLVHIYFAISSSRIRRSGRVPSLDEREMRIELQVTKVAAYLLSVIVMTWCLAAYVGIPWARVNQHQVTQAAETALRAAEPLADAPLADVSLSNLLPIPAHDAILFVHLLAAGFVLTNVVYYGALVFGYRRSV